MNKKIQLAIPSHRTKKHISLTEYKKILKNGKKIDKSISKHLVSFYNSWLKGKINISKTEFKNLYNNGCSLDDIAKQYNVPREHITYLREFFGIKRKGATFQKRLKTETPLTKIAKNIIVGSLLGDGHITTGGYFSEKHSEKQMDYLQFKSDILKNIHSNQVMEYSEKIDDRSGKIIKTYALRTITHSFLIKMRKEWYQNTVKILPKNIQSIMNRQILAIWYMDDGSTDWCYRNGTKKYKNQKPSCKICSESFTLEENMQLIDVLKNKFNLNAKILNIGENKNRLYFSTIESEKLIKLISPFMVDSMKYKTNEEEYVRMRL